MALRQIEIYLPSEKNKLPEYSDFEERFNIIERREFLDTEEGRTIQLILKTENTDALLRWIDDEVGWTKDYRVLISEVLATLPRIEEDDDDGDGNDTDKEEESTAVARISQEEIYESVRDSISVTNVHYTLVVLSTIVAAGGMLGDSTAVVIGAMVIAPLIGPNIALSLGTTLAHTRLLLDALRVNFLSVAIVVALSVAGGFVLNIDPEVPELATRTTINISDVALALAAGVAAVLSVTRGVSEALIGVMVAVALLPPLAATGLLIGAGDFELARSAALLTATNIVAINLAGVVTFLVQGIRPTTWYESKKARRSTIVAVTIWLVLLGGLIAAILLS